MKAVALDGNRSMRLIDMPEPRPRPGDVKLRVLFCGICGSDVHFYSHAPVSPESPLIMGHEFTGEVVELGDGVSGLERGDVVVVNPAQSCGECEACSAGDEELCRHRYEPIGFKRHGAYAEYVCVRAWTATKLPSGARPDLMALTEPLGVCLRGVERGGVRAGEKVAITGAGPIGLLILLAAKRKGAGRVIVSETIEGRRELARRLGAEVVNPEATPLPLAAPETDVAFECAGVAAAMDDCLSCIRKEGRVVVMSLFNEPYSISMMRLMLCQQQVIGSYACMDTFPEAAAVAASGEIALESLITSRIGLRDVPDAFECLCANPGTHCKILVSPDL